MKNKGFTLIELIIAISVLVILTGLMAPQFMRHLEKSREAVCKKNRDEMLNMYRMEYIGDDKYEVKDIIIQYRDRKPCPSDGTYIDYSKEWGSPWILCSVHDKEIAGLPPEIAQAEFVYKSMTDFVGKKVTDIEDVLKKFYGTDSGHWPGNDNLRKYLRDSIYTEGWPQFDKAILQSNGVAADKALYIQPYINIKEKENVSNTTKEDVLMYASSDTGSNWNATLIYKVSEKKWYKAPKSSTQSSIMFANQSWAEIEKKMTEQKWEPLQ
ncbi:MAG: prepilin-type N-terminal cleavage/methylation domain-containing protein [Clostridium sp.]